MNTFSKEFKEAWKKVDEVTKQQLLVDKEVHAFLKPIFDDEAERTRFIKQCLNKLTARRMLNHAHWYLEMADAQEKVARGRPAIKIIFLMSLAEYITKARLRDNRIGSLKAIQSFFKFISKEDKALLQRGIEKLMVKIPHSKLRFTSLIRILYDVRNRAVHGEDYYSFSLPSPERKRKAYEEDGYTHWSLATTGYLMSQPRRRGGLRRKVRIPLDVTITYEDLREVFRRTAIANIQSLL